MGEIDRAQLSEPPRRHRIGIAGGLAERGQHAAPAQASQRILEGRLADRIVDHRHALPARDLAHALDEILLGVDDRMIAAVCARDLGLFLAADGADHGRAEMLRPLAHDQADTAGRGMDQDRVAGLDRDRSP